MTLHVLSAGAAKGLVQALERQFSATHRTSLEGTFGAVGAMHQKLLAGEACDVIILTRAMIDSLAGEHRVDATTIADLGRVFTGIAVPSSPAVPRVDDPSALRDALGAASAIYLPDPERATAGIHFVGVLKRLGIYDSVQSRLRPHPNGAVAMRAMADAAASGERNLIGCTQVSEILYTAGVSLAGELPGELGLATTYSAAVCSGARDPTLARAFVAALTGRESAELRRSGGFA